MSDIIEKLDEALSSDRVLRHVKWDELLYSYWELRDRIKEDDPGKSVNVKNAQKIGDQMLSSLQNFLDKMPMLQKYVEQRSKEISKLSKL
jgi:hypothetical protein